MKKDTFSNLKKVVAKAKNISILTHVNPDGDAMGSSLGLFHYLKKKKKNVKVIVPNSFPGFLKWLPGSKQVLVFEGHEAKTQKQITGSDLVFILDFNNYSRLEKLSTLLNASKAPKILIDHHRQPDTRFDHYFHDEHASSTAELVYDFVCGIDPKNKIDKNTATCLHTGILTDTGSFRFPSTSEKTFRITASLVKAGANNAEIYNKVYDDYTEQRLKLLGHCLDKLSFIHEYNAAYIALSEEELKRFDYKKGDTEGIVNYALSVRGVKFSAFFSEKDGIIKISFRSKGKFDVNKFARAHFNGGGHVNAAGGMSKLPLQQTIENFLNILPTYKADLNK
ncbi:MAG TPA: bifunctional oligoribonuclease/PAP phosphatase NrnA [Bacteroidia bacterium]|nr:bifunctional oligoribonuclease/PAP phosphatase NrnA [Bacteroidia bacterium]